MTAKHTDLLVATLGTDGAGTVLENYGLIQQGINWCQDRGIPALVTNECALTGYPPISAAPELAQRQQMLSSADALLRQAQAANVQLVLGLAVPGERGWTNEVHWLGPDNNTQVYRKQMLMPSEVDCRGSKGIPEAALVDIKGWQCAVHICYEIRFAPLLSPAAAQADALLAIAHMAGPDPDQVKATVIPAHYSTRAAEWACPLVLANTIAADQVLPAGAWDASGVAVAPAQGSTLSTRCNVSLHKLRHRDQLDPWLSKVREDQLKTCHFDSSHKDS